MSAKLSDAEFIARHRAANRLRSTRQREKRYEGGRVSLTVWVQATTKARLLALAATEETPVAEVADRLLTAALASNYNRERNLLESPSIRAALEQPAESYPQPVDKSVDTELTARNRRILELHEQGVSTRDIAVMIGCSKSTTARVVKGATP